MKRRQFKKILSGFLVIMTLITTILSPITISAQEYDDDQMTPPPYMDVKDLLDSDEVVAAKDLELDFGSKFDARADFSNIDIPDSRKVKVTFEGAWSESGEEFSTEKADSYKAIYYVQPLTSDHPKYQISRYLIVKSGPSDQLEDSEYTEEENYDDDFIVEENAEEEENEFIVEDEEFISENETDELADESDYTENEEELALDSELESSEDQDVYDEESGLYFSDVMEELVEAEDVDLLAMEEGEKIRVMLNVASEPVKSTQSVDVICGSCYRYADYGLGSYKTYKYTVTFGSVTAIAYCIQPSKSSPEDGTYTITKLSDKKALAKVCYYGTKASGEEGFFAEKHPDFSAGKRFVITHLAASYANGSTDWDSGANSEGRKLAMELYNYCMNMPEIPDVAMSFSDNSVEAYIEGDIQRTKEISFNADQLQSITFKLPAGVCLVNVTEGQTSKAGDSVQISGGTKFYLTAPLTQATDVNESFKATMKGSITKDYSAYKITTGSDIQDLALVFGEGVSDEKYIDFQVNWTKAPIEKNPVKCELSIIKKGELLAAYNGKEFEYKEDNLEGAEFEIYTEDTLVTTVKTDVSGLAFVKDLNPGKYIIKEKQAPNGYVRNLESQEVYFNSDNQDTDLLKETITFKNARQKAAITVIKQDAENNNPIAGVEFGLYNTIDITDTSGNIIVKANTLLQKIHSDAAGKVIFTLDLPLGQYYVKELDTPDGYISSEEVLSFDASYQGQDQAVIALKKVIKNQPTGCAFSKSDLTSGEELDGAKLSVIDQKGTVIDTWISVKNKPHIIKQLTVGNSYILREELAPYGYLKGTDVEFKVTNSDKLQKIEMKDEVPKGHLIINKKGQFLDKVSLIDRAKGGIEHLFEYITGSLENVSFDIYAAENIKAADGVSEDYYKADELIATITTDASGIASLEDMPVGKYYVRESSTAHGYILDSNPRYIDLTYRDQNTSVITYDEEWQNERKKVSVNVLKVEKDTERVLQGATLGIYAAEDIVSVSGNVLIKKDELIESKISDKKGQIKFTADLPINGKYYVKEISAPNGFATSNERKEFTFDGHETDSVETYNFTFENQPTTVEITKADITNGEEIPGAHLKLTDSDGNTVDEWISTEKAHIIKELLVGNTYKLTETKAADGFVTAESVEFNIENTGEIQRHQMLDDVTKVKISKTDITGKEEIPGANLSIFNEEGNLIESWTSTNEPHYIEKLPIGIYTLHEEQAPKGFIQAEDMTFEVFDTGEIQMVSMKDDTAKGKLIINKTDEKTEKPLRGVEFELRDSSGKVLEKLETNTDGRAESGYYEIASYKEGKYTDPVKYYLVETKTLDGYSLDSTEHEIIFEYVDQNTPIIEISKNITNKEENKSGTEVKTEQTVKTSSGSKPKTGDDTKIWFPIMLMIASFCLLAGIIFIRKRR